MVDPPEGGDACLIVNGNYNRIVDQEQEDAGLPELDRRVIKDTDRFAEGKRRVDAKEYFPRVAAQEIVKNPFQFVSAEDQSALMYDKQRIINESEEVRSALEEAIEDGDRARITELNLQLSILEDAAVTNRQATKFAGTEASAALRIRIQEIKDDYSLLTTLTRRKIAREEIDPKTGKLILPEEVRLRVESLTNKLNEALAELEKYRENKLQEDAKRELQKIKNEPVIRNYIYKAKTRQAETKEEILAERQRIRSAFNKSLSQINLMFDPTAVKHLAEWTRNLVKDGMNTVEDITDEIYRSIEEDHPELGITKRDIMEAVSGYGKTSQPSKEELDIEVREIKRQMRLVLAFEDATAGQVPKRSGFQRDPSSDKVRELERRVKQAMREAGIDSDSMKTPEEQWKTSQDAIISRLKHAIADNIKRMETGQAEAKKLGIEYNEEAKDLVKINNKIKEILEFAENKGKKEIPPEQKIRQAISATEKSLSEWEQRINDLENGIKREKKISKTPETPELKSLRAERDLLKDLAKTLKEEAKPKKTPLELFKERKTKRLADLQRKYETKDYSKKQRKTINLDRAALDIEAKINRVKDMIEQDIRQDKLNKRSKAEKWMDYSVKWRKNIILSSLTIAPKLFTATGSRSIFSPAEDAAGSLLRHVPGLRDLMDAAPSEGGGFNVEAEVAALAEFINKATYKDAWTKGRTGKNSLDVLYGKKGDYPPEALSFFAYWHGAIKTPLQRSQWIKYVKVRGRWAANHGYDITDPSIIANICGLAYQDSQRAILMNANVLSDGYQGIVRWMERQGIGGKIPATLMNLEMPIVRVPTNLVLESANYMVGIPKAGLQMAYIFATNGGSEGAREYYKNNPNTADSIARSLKKGLFGVALLMIGGAFYENFGGYYQPGEKRKPGDLKANEVKIDGKIMPHWVGHIPPVWVLQAGATIRRTEMYYAERLMPGGNYAALKAVASGLADQIPFLAEPHRLELGFRSADTATKKLAELGTSLVVPPDVANVARWTDKDIPGFHPVAGEQIPRKPETAGDVFKMSIPGLRQEVPEDNKREKKELKGKLVESVKAGDKDELRDAQREGRITEEEGKNITKKAESEEFVESMKRLSFDEMAKRIPNATADQKEILYPIFYKKVFNAIKEKKIPEDKQQKYYDMLEDMRP